MPLELIIALVLTLPIVAVITAFVWYLNLGGAWSALKRAGKTGRSAARTDRLETGRV
jgi:hypothetical protein